MSALGSAEELKRAGSDGDETAGIAALPDFVATARLPGRSVLADTDLTAAAIAGLLATAAWLKEQRRQGEPHPYLAGKTLGMIFQHPSTRTRNAFQAGMEQLGGHATFLGTHELQLTRGETLADTAAIMSRYVDGIAARFAIHDDLVQFAAGASVPVYNALTEVYHPIEALSDVLTLQERFGDLSRLRLAYVGDGNNVCHSLLLSGAAMGLSLAVASPVAYQPRTDVLANARALAAASGATITLTDDPLLAADGADAIYTDAHESMGEENDPAKEAALAPYRVTEAVMAAAKSAAVFMHCLPIHRGQEVDEAVVDGPRSIVFEQAENRLHMHKALLLLTMG
ncbi:MAG: ornithine carbamoyltransferase [Chloroflexia bacterium]|nr:ornithine carbamoyltransferase [Chloroflexia bacterium]